MSQEQKLWFKSNERMIWIKNIQSIFYTFGLSHDSSHVIPWFKSYNQRKKFQILKLNHNSNKPFMWIKSSSHLNQIKGSCNLNHTFRRKSWFTHSCRDLSRTKLLFESHFLNWNFEKNKVLIIESRICLTSIIHSWVS